MAEIILEDASASELSQSDKGATSELLACAALMRAGYFVYRAESPSAPFDLVAYRDGQCLRVEVKSIVPQARDSYAPTFHWPTNTSWDLLAVVGADRVFFFDSNTTIDEARDAVRSHYGHKPLSVVRALQPCGTTGGYYRHRKRGESICAKCRTAIRDYSRSRRSTA